jgi:hypothetical protein
VHGVTFLDHSLNCKIYVKDLFVAPMNMSEVLADKHVVFDTNCRSQLSDLN